MASAESRSSYAFGIAQVVVGQGVAGGLLAALQLVLVLSVLAPWEIARAASPAQTVLRLFLLGPAFGTVTLFVGALLLVTLTAGKARPESLAHALRMACVLALLGPPAYSAVLFTVWNGQIHFALLATSAVLLPLLIRASDALAHSMAVVAADSARGVTISVIATVIIGVAFAVGGSTPDAPQPAERDTGRQQVLASPGPPPALVLLVTVDTLRADHLSSYGYGRKTSPTIDDLASQGALFERVIAASSGSLPSLFTLVTGQSPRLHGVTDQRGELHESSTTLAEHFSSAGFATVGLVVSPLIERRHQGLARGFERFDRLAEASASEAASRFLNLVPRGLDRPLFAWLHLYDPHTPYEPTADVTEGFLNDDLYERRRLRTIDYGSYGGIRLARTLGRRRTGNPQDREEGFAAALYDGEILVADHAIGRVLDSLRETYRAEDSVVLVTADHGEVLAPGTGNLFYQHALELYEPAIRIPAVLWAPGRVAAGVRHPFLACQDDLAPTLLATAGLQPLAASSGLDLLGEMPPKDSCISQTAWWDDVSLRAMPRSQRSPTYALVEEDWKLIARLTSDLDGIRNPIAWLGAWRSALVGFWRRDELYRIRSDPYEGNNLIATEHELADAMRRRLAASLEHPTPAPTAP